MKKTTLTFVAVISAVLLLAQTPQALKYQAVVRDNAGNVLVNQNVTFRFSILQGSASGTLIFSETHEAITNEFGLVNFEIGTGEPQISFLIEIDWSTGEKFLEVELDPAGGYTFTSMGTTQLLSVPYALYSEATGDTTRWRKNNDDLYFTNGRVGIGAVLSPVAWAKLLVKGNFMIDAGNAVIRHTDATESGLNIYNTVSDWELVAASDNNRFDIRKWGGVPALSISDDNYIGIGTTTPAGILDIAGAYHFPAIDGTSGQVLQTDGSGVLSWNDDDGGATEINELTDGKTDASSVFLGSGAGANDDGTYNLNVAVGIDALNANTSGHWNTANGFQALYSNTEGNGNTANGYLALYSNITGYSNTANGYRALFSHTTGSSNTANGAHALHNNLTGFSNTANGAMALNNNTTGSYNTANGTRSLLYNTTGSSNTANGYQANYLNNEGSYNTIIGFQAGMGPSNHNKSGNVFLGYQAGFNDTTDNKLYIENSASSTPLIYGDFNSNLLRVNGTFDINGAYQFPTTDGAAGQVLQTDGSGELNWITYAGGSVNEINDLSDGKTGGNSVFLGSGAGVNDDGTNNQNVAVGIGALAANISGDYNTANGTQALFSNTIGIANTAIGYQALKYDTTGNKNTAVGYRTLYSNTTGNYNTANGFQALLYNTEGERNTAIGNAALNKNTIGNHNTAIGDGANYFNEEGSTNTIIGYQAGMGTSLHNKSGNVFLGYQAGFNETGDNKLYIDNSDTIAPLIYGDFENDILAFNADVGIGTTDPEAKIDILMSGSGSWQRGIRLLNQDLQTGDQLLLTLGAFDNTNNVGNIYFNYQGDGSFQNRLSLGLYGVNDVLNIMADGNVGIGTTNPWYAKLDVRGSGPDDGAIFRLGNSDGSHRLSFFPGRENDPNPFIQWKEGDPLRFTTDEGGWSEKMRISSNGWVGIGTPDPAGILDIAGAYHFPSTDGTNGQVLQTDGSGELNWITYAGGTVNEINDLSDGKTGGNSVFLGSGAGADDDGTDNQNVAVGIDALNANTSGANNTANGFEALYHNTTGNNNTANGLWALYSNMTGSWNTASGPMALAGNKTGNGNTAIGMLANVANEHGSNNTIIGFEAGGKIDVLHNKSGNVFLGYGAGYNATNGSDRNVFLGYMAGYSEAGSNKLYIANSDDATPLIYGEFDNDIVAFNANVGIGTTSPAYPLSIKPGTNTTGLYIDHDQMGAGETHALNVHLHKTYSGFSDIFGGSFYITNDNSSGTTIGLFSEASGTSSGIKVGIYGTAYGSGTLWAGYFENGDVHIANRLGIGTTSPASMLDVQGNVTIRDSLTGDIVIELGKGLDYAEGFNVTDKINIQPGAILCIDPENPGKLKISENPYDKTVAGIVAGANGLGSGVRLGTQEFDCDVALAGRVYCNTIATTENIEPGDMLTTSSIPGFAMKVTDFENAHGAILGKAMEKLEKGKKGQILVLVTLH